MSLTDNELNRNIVAAIRGGSLKVFNTVYSLYAHRLLLYIGRVALTKEDAEEIVHDIFMEFWKNRAKLTDDIDIRTLLFSIAYKRRIDLYRQSLKMPIFQDYMELQNDLVADSVNNLEYEEFCRRFDIALSKLPSRLQNMIIMSRIRGLSNSEIAQALNISEKTVKNGISEGLKILRNLL